MVSSEDKAMLGGIHAAQYSQDATYSGKNAIAEAHYSTGIP